MLCEFYFNKNCRLGAELFMDEMMFEICFQSTSVEIKSIDKGGTDETRQAKC